MIPMTVEHPILSLGGPATTVVTSYLGPNQRVEIPDELTTATVLANIKPLPSGTFQGVALLDGMDARGYVARLTRESGPDMARTARSIMLDAARIAKRSGLDCRALRDTKRPLRHEPRYMTLPNVAGGWEFSAYLLVTPDNQGGALHPALVQEVSFTSLRNAGGCSVLFAMEPPYTSTYAFTVGYSKDKSSCSEMVRYDEEMGVGWTEGYSFNIGGEMLAGFRTAAGFDPGLSLQDVANELMQAIMLSGQFEPAIVRKGVKRHRSDSHYSIFTKATNPMRHNPGGNEYIAQVLVRDSEKGKDARIFIHMNQPCTRISVEGRDSFWPLADGLVTLLWDNIATLAAPSYVAARGQIRAS